MECLTTLTSTCNRCTRIPDARSKMRRLSRKKPPICVASTAGYVERWQSPPALLSLWRVETNVLCAMYAEHLTHIQSHPKTRRPDVFSGLRLFVCLLRARQLGVDLRGKDARVSLLSIYTHTRMRTSMRTRMSSAAWCRPCRRAPSSHCLPLRSHHACG